MTLQKSLAMTIVQETRKAIMEEIATCPATQADMDQSVKSAIYNIRIADNVLSLEELALGKCTNRRLEDIMERRMDKALWTVRYEVNKFVCIRASLPDLTFFRIRFRKQATKHDIPTMLTLTQSELFRVSGLRQRLAFYFAHLASLRWSHPADYFARVPSPTGLKLLHQEELPSSQFERLGWHAKRTRD